MSKFLDLSKLDDKERKKFEKQLNNLGNSKHNILKRESTNSDTPIGLIMWIFVVIFFLIGILIF